MLPRTDLVSTGVAIGSLSGAVVAAFLIVRFGLTLSAAARAGRYALAVGGITLAASAGALLVPQSDVEALYTSQSRQYSVSPDGRYVIRTAYIQVPSSRGWGYRAHYRPPRMIRLSDRHSALVPWSGEFPLSSLHWTMSGAAYFIVDHGHRANHLSDRGLAIIQMSPGGKATTQEIALGEGEAYSYNLLPSPDSNLVAVRLGQGKSGLVKIVIVDVTRGRKLPLTISGAIWEVWWQSNTEIGYHDTRNKRHVVRVTE